MTEPILGFFGKYRFLSNFEYAEILYNGKYYISNEHAYQAAKCLLEEEHEKVRLVYTAREAKNLGQVIKRRPDWDAVKDEIMFEINLCKFTQHEHLRKQLIATGDAYLEETNNWGDTYWGVCNSLGLNKLGHTLMRVRTLVQ